MTDFEERGEEINFKHWLSRTLLVAITLILIILLVERYYNVQLLIITITAITTAIMFGLFHEFLHYRVAVKLGYKPVWYRTRMMFGFDIDTNQKTEHQKILDSRLNPKDLKKQNVKDTLKIGRAPYYTIIPLSAIILIISYSINLWGVVVGCGATLFLHAITFAKEGREV